MLNLREKILSELKTVDNPRLLGQIFDFLQILKQNGSNSPSGSNRESVIALAGSIPKQDGLEMQQIIDQEFNKIEGEW
ncbi:MAG: hypothetical protein AAFR66_17460 [Bacteroidota bacterium]